MDQASHFSAELQLKLERMRAGDKAARDELLKGVSARLEKLARKMLRKYPHVRRWTETGDVLQNALIRLLRALESLQPKTTRDFFNLAAVQIRRELIDMARHFYGPQGQATHLESGTFDSLNPAPAKDGDQDLEFWTSFHKAVETLPTEEREVVSLIFYHGWQQQQVAELFQVNTRTIRRWWQAALVKLHDTCKDLPAM
jgi:RNA polymerase sigma factor (sigma-70 family)